MSPLSPGIVNGLFTLAGVIVGSFSPLIIARLNAKNEERKQVRELGFKVGLANFELTKENVRAIATASGQPSIDFPGLHFHVMVGIKKMEIVLNPLLSAEEIASELSKVKVFTDSAILAAKAKQE